MDNVLLDRAQDSIARHKLQFPDKPKPALDSGATPDAAAAAAAEAALLDSSNNNSNSSINTNHDAEAELEAGGYEDEGTDDFSVDDVDTDNVDEEDINDALVEANSPVTDNDNGNDNEYSQQQDLVLPEASNLLEEVWLSVFTPGVNSRVVLVMDMCFYALFLCLFGLLIVSGGNFHVVFLLIISVCLFVTVKWFIAESKKVAAESSVDASGIVKDESGSVNPESKKNQ
ncbi:ER protein Pkr1-domain-containing protein [Obelidium mucronatum]|nr:ER protein Pkr1-domain-containing protein [Obelidium mucronatum]